MGVRVPPRAAPFSFEKGVVLVGIAMHLPCTLDSCIAIAPAYCRHVVQLLVFSRAVRLGTPDDSKNLPASQYRRRLSYKYTLF